MKSTHLFLLSTLLSGSMSAQIWSATGMTTGVVKCLSVNGPTIYAGTTTGMQMSVNNGTTFTTINNGLTTAQVEAFTNIGTNLFAGTNGGGVFLSTNNGSNWNQVNTGLTDLFVSCFAVSGNSLYAGTSNGIFLTTNNGTNWSDITGTITNPVIRSLFVSGSTLIAGTNGPMGIYTSTNTGTTWTFSNITGTSNQFIISFAAIGGTLFAGNGGNILISTDNGLNWNTGCNNIGASHYDLDVDGTTLYCAVWAGYGPVMSTNYGVTCTLMGAGGLGYDAFSIGHNSNYVFAGTDGYGIWKFGAAANTVGISELTSDLLTDIKNPFNENITVPLNSGGKATVSLYDISGKELCRDQSEEAPLKLNTFGLAAGIYILKVASADGVQFRKMVKE
jgi:hypothetical protein